MLDSLSPNQKLLGGLALAWYFLTRDDAASPAPGETPGRGGYPTLPGGQGGGSGQALLPVDASQQFFDPTLSRRVAAGFSDAPRFDPAHDVVIVRRPAWFGVVGCCKAWATAGPSVRNSWAGGGPMMSPRSRTGRNCGCLSPTSENRGSRSWWLPIERANRTMDGSIQAVEYLPTDPGLRSGTAGTSTHEVPGFQHEGRAFVDTRESRNFKFITDADPDILYFISAHGELAAYHRVFRTNVAPADLRPLYKGVRVPANPDPWAVDPWRAWMLGEDGGRGNTPLHVKAAPPGRLQWDFVAPVYMWAFRQFRHIQLPFPGIQLPSRGVR